MRAAGDGPAQFVAPGPRGGERTAEPFRENVTASRFGKETNKSMKRFAAIISGAPRIRLIAAFTATAQASGPRNPGVCAVKPAECIGMALIGTVPSTATSGCGTGIRSGSNAPTKETGSRVTASSGVPAASAAPLGTVGGITIPAAPAPAAPGADGRPPRRPSGSP
ncbi:hypothetical protein AB0I52_08800 [Streptomyces sp. NPDC050423]|uniref:hypothetical protein n=1 Tax=Streptomyces sp. NPDC050423 TaxID=3155402 RepID=UPI003445515F